MNGNRRLLGGALCSVVSIGLRSVENGSSHPGASEFSNPGMGLASTLSVSCDSFAQRENIMATGTNQKWEGRWDQLKGRVKKLWGQITDDDLKKAEGDYQRTVGLIKERTGESLEEIEKKLQKS
jgi:uncharacterized protein YjbJ (UPF0337 family)